MGKAWTGRIETILELSRDTAPFLATTLGEWPHGARLFLSNFLEKLELLTY